MPEPTSTPRVDSGRAGAHSARTFEVKPLTGADSPVIGSIGSTGSTGGPNEIRVGTTNGPGSDAHTGTPGQRGVVIIGGGFTALGAALEIAKAKIPVTIVEADAEVGGLAGSFDVEGERLEKFYHHWFTNDRHIIELVEELGTADRIVHRPTRTGMYFANNFFKLSTPMDVLRFTPLGLLDRVRLGMLVLAVRRVKKWEDLEGVTAEDWLKRVCGQKVYKVVWEPLLRGKFGPYASELSAVWFWNKLKLRGSSRGKGGAEMLAYYQGGFAALADALAARIRALGGKILTSTRVSDLVVSAGRVRGVHIEQPGLAAPERSRLDADVVISTPAPALLADLVEPHAPVEFTRRLREVKYLANLCLVLRLDRSLSSTYWLNVNDPGFPYVGVIEHTNFEPPSSYKGNHIVYLSKYLPESADLYQMKDAEVYEFSLPHIQRMFPAFQRSWVRAHHVWRARHAQPVITLHYSRLIPGTQTPMPGLLMETMAQVYPEDRGTNYAIRNGRRAGRLAVQQVAELRAGRG